MATVLESVRGHESPFTLRDLVDRLGPMPFWRVRTDPPPGHGIAADVLRIFEREKRYCELIDGILVEKTVGYEESAVAIRIACLLNAFIMPRKLGVLTGEGGMLRLAPDHVRIPDVAFVSWPRIPGGKLSGEPIPLLVPNLAVEVLSVSNTPQEMQRKLQDYFDAGVELVWYIDPRGRTVEVFTSATQKQVLHVGDTLTGGAVLPEFRVLVNELFEGLEQA